MLERPLRMDRFILPVGALLRVQVLMVVMADRSRDLLSPLCLHFLVLVLRNPKCQNPASLDRVFFRQRPGLDQSPLRLQGFRQQTLQDQRSTLILGNVFWMGQA